MDLGSATAISAIVIDWEASASGAFEIETSDDASTWTQIASGIGAGNYSTQQFGGLSVTARYVRVVSHATYGTAGVSMYELKVYSGYEPPTPTPTVVDPCSLDSDGDGVNDCDDACPDVWGDGPDGCPAADPCSVDSDGDGVNDCDDACPYEWGDGPDGCPAADPCMGDPCCGNPMQTYYYDNDNDNYGSDNSAYTTCTYPGPGYVLQGGDFDDNDPDVYPGHGCI